MSTDRNDLHAQLRTMEKQLTSMIALADEQEDYLLGALLCEAQACVVRRFGDAAAD